MKRAIPWLAAIFFVGCLALGVFCFRERTELTKATLTQSASEKEAQSRIAELQGEVGALKSAKAKDDEQIAKLTQDPVSLQKSQGGGDNGGAVVVHISDIIRDHPEYMPLYEKQMRRNIDRMYGNGLNTLNLPPDQLAQLKNLLVERQMGEMDAQQAAQSQGLTPGSPAWQTAMQQASQDVGNQIASILGPNSTNLLAQLQMRSAIQNQVQNSYAPDFADAGMPLTPDQTNGLIQAMADANYAGKDTSTRPANYNVADPTTDLSPHDDRIINNATPVLSPTQVQLLTTDQAENEQLNAIRKAYSAGGKPVIFVP
jgi:hypothetical protein